MGLFSGLTKMLFGDPSKGIRKASDAQLGFQREALDYLKELDAPLLEARSEALPLLTGFFTGDEGAQQDIVNRAMASPFYQQLLETGQEGVLGRAGAMGLTRSGNVARDLSQSNQSVLQGLVGNQLQGLQSLAYPQLRSSGISNILQNMGQTAGQAGIAQAQAQQSGLGQLLGLLGAGATGFLTGGFSDIRLKKNIEYIGKKNGHNLWGWVWNEEAEELGLKGPGFGVMAQEVEKYNPAAIGDLSGYKVVDYSKLGVNHG